MAPGVCSTYNTSFTEAPLVHLELTTLISSPIERCFDLSRSVELHLRGADETGEKAIGGTTSGLLGPGDYVRWRATHFGVPQNLSSRITAFEFPRYFQDTMFEGAFKFMRHDHFFTAVSPDRTHMTDHFDFAAPLPVLGPLAERLFLARYMKQFLEKRNAVIKEIAESPDWHHFLP